MLNCFFGINACITENTISRSPYRHNGGQGQRLLVNLAPSMCVNQLLTELPCEVD
jgi:hypothetical protein